MALGNASTILPSRVIVSSGMCSHQFTNVCYHPQNFAGRCFPGESIVAPRSILGCRLGRRQKAALHRSFVGWPAPVFPLPPQRNLLGAGGTLRLADRLLALDATDLALGCKPPLLSDVRQNPSLSNRLAEPLQQAILGFAWAKFNTHFVTPLRLLMS